MPVENDISSSDTLERSNITSLQTDVKSTKKNSETNGNNTNLNLPQICLCQQYLLGNHKFIPCPVLNPDLEAIPYSQCVCQLFQQAQPYPHNQNVQENVEKQWQRFNFKWPRQSYANKKDKSSEAKAKNRSYSRNETEVYNVFNGIPRKKSSGMDPSELKPNSKDDTQDKPEKIEIYYFDHGNSAYYHTTDLPPVLGSDRLAEKSNSNATQFWAEIFGYVHIVISYLTTFVLQFIRCILFSCMRPLTVGVVQLVADYFLKPLLSITFNGIIQPFLILFYNMATSLRDCCEPLATILGYYTRELAVLFRACRLIEINNRDKENVDT